MGRSETWSRPRWNSDWEQDEPGDQHHQDFRNYKVSIDKAKNVLSFHPQHDVRGIVGQLIAQMSRFSDLNNPAYYNIQVFRELEKGISSHSLGKPAGVGR